LGNTFQTDHVAMCLTILSTVDLDPPTARLIVVVCAIVLAFVIRLLISRI
jgi:hypothetical protein